MQHVHNRTENFFKKCLLLLSADSSPRCINCIFYLYYPEDCKGGCGNSRGTPGNFWNLDGGRHGVTPVAALLGVAWAGSQVSSKMAATFVQIYTN